MKKTIKLLLGLSILLYFGSCTKDYLDINYNPNSPTEPELNQLLSGSQYYMVQALSQGNFIGTGLGSYTHHLVSRDNQNYGMTPGANNPFNTWNYLYTYVLKDYDAIIEYAEPEENLIYVGIAKTLKAYAFSVMVDLWGDVPYTEFNVPGLIYPVPDSSKDIYNSLLLLIDEAHGDLSNTTAANALRPGSDDFIYSGNVESWIRLNNTLKLRLLVQSRKAKSDITGWQSSLSALIADDNFITEDEDFQFWFNNVTNPSVERHPAFTSLTGQHTHFISPYFYETMRGDSYNTTDNPFANIEDPRVPYYFYNQLPDGSRTDTESPHEYRNGNFVSIFFASNGPNSAGSNDHSYTKYGIYPIGGKYDNGEGGRIATSELPTGIAPHKMITYASLNFMLAELALVGDINADDEALLEEAIIAAFDHVNSVVARNGSANPAPSLTNTARDEFIDAILQRYDAADSDGKMRILMTQKWIHDFMNPIDSYNDYRRTGYPLLFDPNKTQEPGNGVNLVVTARSDRIVQLHPIAAFPRSLYYPTNSEIELNPNMTQKSNLTTPFIFWDK